jgi:hypothetical protein
MFEAAEADLAAVKKVLQNSHLQGCVVRLRGLPYTATAADVAAFFEVSRGPLQSSGAGQSSNAYSWLLQQQNCCHGQQQRIEICVSGQVVHIPFAESWRPAHILQNVSQTQQPTYCTPNIRIGMATSRTADRNKPVSHGTTASSMPFYQPAQSLQTPAVFLRTPQGVQLADGDDAIVFTVTVDGRPTGTSSSSNSSSS